MLCFAFDVRIQKLKHEYLVQFPFCPLLNLGEFSRKRKGGLPLKNELRKFRQKFTFFYFLLICCFCFGYLKTKTDALACALYFFLFINTLYYLGKCKWLNHGSGDFNTTPKSTWLNTKKYMTQHQKVHDSTPKSTWLNLLFLIITWF